MDTLLIEEYSQQKQNVSRETKVPWPRFIVCSQPSYGNWGNPIINPSFLFQGKDFRLLWIISCLLLNNTILWGLFSTHCINTQEEVWPGWLLKYLSASVYDKRHNITDRYAERKTPLQIAYMMQHSTFSPETSTDLLLHFIPTFTWNNVKTLFQSIEGVLCLDVYDIETIGKTRITQQMDDPLTKVIVLFTSHINPLNPSSFKKLPPTNISDDLSSLFDMMSVNAPIPLTLQFNASKFELCFVATSDDTNSTNIQWNVYGKLRRLFYEQLHAFWKISRNEPPFPITEDSTTFFSAEYDMVLYTKCPDLHNIQNNYLLSMGNECPIQCPIHQKHLVTCTFQYNKNCAFIGVQNMKCHRYSAYVCPMRYCIFSLCKEHAQQSYYTEKDDDKVYTEKIYESILNENDPMILSEHDEIFPPFLITDVLQEEDSIYSSDQQNNPSDSSVESLLNIEEETTTVSYENDDVSIDENEDFTDTVLPTTDASKVAHWVKEPIANSIPLSVLFNKHLHLLVRRNFEMRATKRAKGFLERIVATSENNIVPLLFPEAMIFPQIFFHQREDGSISGSIPAPLWTSEKFTSMFGHASIVEHMKNRIKNSSLRCSTEPTYLFFAFDAICNYLCFHDCPQLVLCRGYEHMLRNVSIHGYTQDPFRDNQDIIDPRKTVQELAAFLRDHDPTYFYTHTCNVREHFGVAPLQLWVDSQIEKLRNNVSISEFEFEKLVQSYNQRLVVPLTRSWFRAGNYFMHYICESPEQPLGPIKYHWRRWEDNDKSAALQHLHSVLCTTEDKNNPEELKQILSRVICSSRRAIHPSTLQPLFDSGLLSDNEEAIHKYYSYVKTFQEHGDCKDRNYSCHRRTGLGVNDTQCRVTHHGRENPRPNEYSYVHINTNHSPEAEQILQECHLLSTSNTDERTFANVYNNPMLNTGKYYYPAELDEHLVPFNPFLFASHYSSDCLEVCNRAMSSHYLAKYNTLIDKSLQVDIRPGKEYGELKTKIAQISNTKISSSGFYERQLKKANSKDENLTTSGRKLGLPQAIALMLGIPQVYTNVTFEHLPTIPLEQRPGILIKRLPPSTTSNPYPHYDPISEGNDIPNITLRQQRSFPLDRCFSPLEEIIIKDLLSSPDTVDKITLFSIRPPELRFVRSLQNYYKWFITVSRNQNETSLLNRDFFQCPWINGVGHLLQVRAVAIPYILQDELCPPNMGILLYTFLRDNNMHFFTSAEYNRMKALFLCTTPPNDTKMPIIVLSPIKPTQTNRFLIHLLLSLGYYCNEGELFNTTSIIQSFKNASLISSTSPTSDDVIRITKRYIEEQLFFIPSGTRTFDRYAIAAYQAVKVALTENRTVSFDMPSFLYTSLVRTADQHVIEFRKNLTYNIIETLKAEPYAPDATLLHNVTKTSPLPWRPRTEKLFDQSEASYLEHLHTSTLLQQSIDNYITTGSSSPPCVIVIGGPGTGKTFQLKQACLYAISQGLNVLITSLMSERSIVLGCRHLHYLFCIPGYECQDIHQLSDSIIKNINRHPEFSYILETNDAIFIDEAEFNSAELENALDNVLRYIRKKNTYFGGMMVFKTMDVQQLPPIRGHPSLISSLVLTTFHLTLLKEYVRSRTDEALQRIITLIRTLQPLTNFEKVEFINLICSHCTFVDSWNNPIITPDTIRILGTRKGVQTAETAYYKKIQDQGHLIVTRKSEDFENLKTSHGTWKPASNKVIELLNKLVREPEELKLHRGLIVEITFNNGTLWSNGQIGVIIDLPDQTVLQNWKPFPILLAPPGIRHLPTDSISTESLLSHGWSKVNMKVAPDLTHHCQGGMFAKRYQYGIRPMVATTIHKAMGNDYNKIVSSVCDDGINGFRLWEKAQVLVLMSRVHRAQDIIFVGNKDETALRLFELINTQPKYSLYMNYLINHLTESSNDHSSPTIDLPNALPFHLCTAEYPKQDDTAHGYTYVLVSIPRPSVTYIGQTQNLHQRINQHNKGWTTHFTHSITLRPWACMAYVTNFTTKTHRLYFESLWQKLVLHSYPNQSATPTQVLHIGELAISKYHEQYNITNEVDKLRMIRILSPVKPNNT